MRRHVVQLVAALALGSTLVGPLGVGPASASGPAPKLVARATSGTVTLTWSEAGSVRGYVIEQSDNGTNFAMAGVVTVGTTLVRHHLLNGHTYYFVVIAEMTGGGTSSPSNIAIATPVGVPPAPTHVTSRVRPSSALVTFAAPAGDGGDPILSFQVTSMPGARHCAVATTNAQRAEIPRPDTIFSCVVRGLRNGGHYRFRVRARSRAGWSAPSALSRPAQPGRVPSTPSNVTAIPQDQSVIVSWHPSFGGGSPVTAYSVNAQPGGLGCHAPGGATSCTVTGLTNGVPYTFSVSATNAVGTSAPSSPSPATTPMTVLEGAIGPFDVGTSVISGSMAAQITSLAQSIEVSGAQYVALVGYADAATTTGASALGEQRAQAVASALEAQLQVAGASVTIVPSSGAMPTTTSEASSVVASVS